MWILLLAVRLTLTFSGTTPHGLLIPEPLSSTLFYLLGTFLIVIAIFRLLIRWAVRPTTVDDTNRVGQGSPQQFKPWKTTGEVRRPADLLDLSPRQFEDKVVELYTALGHTARRTGRTGDHGVDVVVQASTGEKWVVQCKRWRGNVGEPVIRDFYGVVHHEKADKGTLITTGGFTPQAREWARGKPLTLVDGEQFVRFLRRAQEREGAEDAKRWQAWK